MPSHASWSQMPVACSEILRVQGLTFLHPQTLDASCVGAPSPPPPGAQTPPLRPQTPVQALPDPCPPGWKHLIFIWLLTPRSYGAAYFEDKMNNQEVNAMMLFSTRPRARGGGHACPAPCACLGTPAGHVPVGMLESHVCTHVRLCVCS